MISTGPYRRLGDDRGAIGPLAAVTIAVMIGMAGLVVDIGVWYVQRRNLQGATDAAALAAANRPADAVAIATDLLTRNGYSAAALVSAEAGYYCPDTALSPAARFQLTSCPTGVATPLAPNAVRVRARTTGAPLLARAINSNQASADIRTTAVATRIDEAGLQIASGLVAADLPTSNAVLQSLLGGTGLSLTAVQYDGLISTNVDALTFFDALATRIGVTGGTYGQLLNSSVSVSNILQAEIDALDTQSSVQDTSAAVAGVQALKAKLTGNPSVTLGTLFDLGVWKNEPIGASKTNAALRAGLNVYQLANFTLQIANGSHAVTVPASTLGVPGLLGATIQATAIEPPQEAYFAFGPTGVSVHTAQVRVKLTLQVAGGLLDLPIYVEAAHGDATLSAMGCGADPAYDAWATVLAQTGVVTVYLGNVPAGAMTNFSTPVSYASVTAAPVINVNLLGGIQIAVKSWASAAPTSPTTLNFVQVPAGGATLGPGLTTNGYIARMAYSGSPTATNGWPAEVVSTGIVGGLTNSLGGTNLTTSVCLISCASNPISALATTLVSGVLSTTLGVLRPLLSGLDPLIDGVLRSLGVKVGRTLVNVSGVRCGVPVIVN